MSDHDATLRLNLAASGMLGMLGMLEKESKKLQQELRGIGDEGKNTEKKLHPMLQSAKKGFGEAKTAVVDLGGKLRDASTMALSLGGALSLGAGVKGAIDITQRYKDMAFAIERATGKATSWEDVEAVVDRVNDKWKRKNEEVADSFDHLLRESGDAGFAEKVAGEVAKAANATGKGTQLFTNLADELRDKFGIAADDMGDALASVISTNKVEELTASMDVMGAAAKSMGLQGKEGLAQFIGMVELSGGATKNAKKAIMGLSQAMELLQDAEQSKNIEKKLKVKLHTESGDLKKDALQEIIKATNGSKQELSKVFGGDALKIMAEYGRIYAKAFDGTSGTFKEKSEKGMDAFNAALANAAKTKFTGEQLTKAAEKRTAEDPQRKLDDAMNRFTKAFASPKLIGAIEKLADKAPVLADGFAKLIEFAVDHPLLAGLGAVGARGGMAFGSSMASDGASALGKVGVDVLKGKGPEMAKQLATTIATTAAAHPGWAMAGKALGVAGAGLIAFAITKAIVDARVDESARMQNESTSAGVEGAAAAASGNMGRMMNAQQSLRRKISDLKERDSGVGGVFDQMMLGAARFTTGDKTLKSGNQSAIEEAEKDLAKLESAIVQGSKKSEDALVGAAKTMANEIRGAARELASANQGGGDGKNGLPPKS